LKTQTARPYLTAHLIASEDLELAAVTTDLDVIRGPAVTTSRRTDDGAAGGTMQHQVPGGGIPQDFEDEAARMGSEPIEVARVIIDEVPHTISMTPRERALMPQTVYTVC
jgi:hypothetical protein